tara:strand:- start:2730 stop:3407 length:678 start_codon:yes stop_codon:yes gene_type:complete
MVMNIAVCFSGQLRSIELTYKNINKFLNNNFEDYKIFAHIPENKKINQQFDQYFQDSLYIIEKDPNIRKTKLKNSQFKSVKNKFKSLRKAKIAHMQQLYGIFKCNELKKEYEAKNNLVFDWVLRCRSDLMFYDSNLDLSKMNNKYLYTPNFHNWSGINDRFIISSSENMDTFADLYNYILQNEIDGFNAESIFKNYLDAKSIELREVNTVRFNRVRADGVELQDF